MSSKAHAERLAKALESTDICQVVQDDHTHDQVSLFIRIAPGAEGVWTQLIDRVLTAGEYITGLAHSYNAHICKRYIRKQVGDERKLVFGWNISIQSGSMTESLDVVIKAIKGTLPTERATGETEEMPLSTRARELNTPNENGRGGWTVGGKQDFKVRR